MMITKEEEVRSAGGKVKNGEGEKVRNGEVEKARNGKGESMIMITITIIDINRMGEI